MSAALPPLTLVSDVDGVPLSGPLTPSKLRKKRADDVMMAAARAPAAPAALPGSALVLVNGSDSVRVSFGGDYTYRKRLPCVIGTEKPAAGVTSGAGIAPPSAVYIADDVLPALLPKLDLAYPIQNGVVKDWNAMELMWKHVFGASLRTTAAERPLLMSHGCFNPKDAPDKTAEIVFEGLGATHFHYMHEAVLALYAFGHTTGVSVSCGHDNSFPVPVHEGYAMEFAIPDRQYDIAGRHMQALFTRLLLDRGFKVDNPAAQNALRFMRETQFYVSEDYETDNENAARSPDDMKREYVLPDGREVSVAGERFRVPELLFKPESQGYFDCKEKLGLADRVVAAVAGCAESIQAPLMQHVLPWGGTTLLPNFMERFNADMKAACPRSLTFGLHQAPASDRAWMPALGGSVLTQIAQSLPEFWVTKAEYDEHGAGAVRRKCY